ncbi:Gfo/Idh/MocA family protein [Oricola thermophila]|uniref:Gfo/Idh/MocA family oxidoreductase n=1 Tax=Oricola thermophila TaxID=2742145 RepID=A0A6N1VFW4_9HYPH|nr:Gfo/Idh/MocA family oxidoreductase [Oricola thermophila]QKV19678.1 Gfo/Idh/MocA family oxidoreductase [Oricola thermophila]
MLNIAVFGSGKWADRLVGSVQGKSEKIAFKAAASRNPDRHVDFGEKYGIAIRNYHEVLADPAIDAVLIATAHSSHRDLAVMAAEAGKHVFIEKPLALTVADAERIIAACDKAKVRLAHGFNRRFAPAYLEMVRRLHASEIGEMLHLEGQFSGPSGYALKPGTWRAERAECPAGAMTARGIHALDAMISMAGPVKSVFCYSERRVLDVDIDDVTSALLRFDSGVTGYLASHHATGEIWRLQAYGTRGWLEMRGDTDLVICKLGNDPERIPLVGTDKERAELEAFADFVAGGRAYPVTNQQALNGIAVVEAMISSAQSGRDTAIHQ